MSATSFNYESMGTHFEITIWDLIGKDEFDRLKSEIIKSSQMFDKTYSRFRQDSLVSKIAETSGKFFVPLDFTKMLQMYFDLYEISERTLNPLVGQFLEDLGYDKNYSLKRKGKLSKIQDLLESVEIIDLTTIETKKPLLFDFGALGKGYFVDKIANYLNEHGIERFLVNGSGDIYYKGREPIQVGLEHPNDASKVIGSIDMTTGAMCASAGNRRKWGKFHHIIDPRTLTSADEIIATWVIADNAALSDALATCLFFVAPENFEPKYKFEYLILNKDMKVKRSRGFSAELF